jgi:transcriptional regulator with XRE-family HTH domain
MDEKAWKERLCRRVQDVRRRLGLSQMDFAHKADLSLHTIGKIERRETSPDLMTLLRLSEAHGVPIGDFLVEEPKVAGRRARALRDIMALLKGRDDRTLDFIAGLLRYLLKHMK